MDHASRALHGCTVCTLHLTMDSPADKIAEHFGDCSALEPRFPNGVLLDQHTQERISKYLERYRLYHTVPRYTSNSEDFRPESFSANFSLISYFTAKFAFADAGLSRRQQAELFGGRSSSLSNFFTSDKFCQDFIDISLSSLQLLMLGAPNTSIKRLNTGSMVILNCQQKQGVPCTAYVNVCK